MNILFDNIIFKLQNNGGISRYWYEIISRSLNDPHISSDFIHYHNPQNIFNINIPFESIVDKYRPIFFDKTFNVRINNVNKYDVFHSSYYRNTHNDILNVNTIHDFTPYIYPNGIKGFLSKNYISRSIKKTDFFICISNNTKSDLLYFYPSIDADNVSVIYHGVSDQFRNLELTHDEDAPFLFVGSRASYKNFSVAVEFTKLTNRKLTIVGSELSFKEKSFLDCMLPDRWELHVHVDNKTLNCLYNKAFCLLHFSSYEGFGLTLLEAMKSGCPVLCYKKSCVYEVAGDTPFYFDDLDIHQIYELYENISNDKSLNDRLSNGIIHAEKFNWNKTYTDTIKFYDSIFY